MKGTMTVFTTTNNLPMSVRSNYPLSWVQYKQLSVLIHNKLWGSVFRFLRDLGITLQYHSKDNQYSIIIPLEGSIRDIICAGNENTQYKSIW